MKALSVNKINSRRMTLLLSTRGHDMSLSNTPGAVQSRFQETSQEVQSNQGKASISVTWGIKRQISAKSYVHSNISWQCHRHSLLGAVTNLPKIFLIGWLPARVSISENSSPVESTSRILEDFP